MTSDAGGAVTGPSRERLERVERIRSLVPVVVLVLAALRAVGAMLLPWLREPGWPDLVLMVLATLGAVYLFMTGPPIRARIWAAAAAAVFWLVPCLSALIHGQGMSPATAAMAAVAVVLIAGPPDSPAAFRAAVAMGAVVVVLSLGYGLLTSAGVFTGAFHTVGEYERTALGLSALRGITLHPNTLGPLAALTLFLSIALALSTRRAGAWIIPALCLIALLWSQSRSAIVGALITGVAWIVVARWHRSRAPVIGLALLAMWVPVLATYSYFPQYPPFDGWFTGRPVAWTIGLLLFASDPATGYGPDAFNGGFWQTAPDAWWQPLHAHNQVVEVLAQTGFLGLVALVAVTSVAVVAALRRVGRAGQLAAVVVVFTAVQGAVEVPLGLTYFPISYLFPALLVAALAYTGDLGESRGAGPAP